MTRLQTLSHLPGFLAERRNAIVSSLVHLERGELSGSPLSGDLAEQAVATECEEFAHNLAEVERRELAWIDHALDRVRDGRYGVCENCGTSISMWRLRAAPFATRCVRCQVQAEQANC